MFDIVIPLGPNDITIIRKQLQYTKKNIIGYRNIYIISYDNNFYEEGCITICEDLFPFNMKTIEDLFGKINRNGWYLQQLLKLYAGIVIPNILDKYLVIDSDTFFLKPTIFYKDGKCLYAYGSEYHIEYFHHMNKLDNELQKQYHDKSGICHHMIFETKYIKEIFDSIEKKHCDTFYNIFLKNVTFEARSGAGASEYEIYFNYIFKNYPDKIELRKLNWVNTCFLELDSNYDYISYHHYSRK